MKATHNLMTTEQQKHKEQIAKQTFELSLARLVLLVGGAFEFFRQKLVPYVLNVRQHCQELGLMTMIGAAPPYSGLENMAPKGYNRFGLVGQLKDH